MNPSKSAPKFTPGPWTERQNIDVKKRFAFPFELLDGHGIRLAIVTATAEDAANARLIAAAPDGYKANGMALAYLTSGALAKTVQESAVGRAVVEALRAALAKAAGR